MSEVTQTLSALKRGAAIAVDKPLPLVYDELRRLTAGANPWKAVFVGSYSQANPARCGNGLDCILAAPAPASAVFAASAMTAIHTGVRGRRRLASKPVFTGKVT